MLNEIILASKSKVRKEILDKNEILSRAEASNIDEDPIKESLIKKKATTLLKNTDTLHPVLQTDLKPSMAVCILSSLKAKKRP